jgi:hypothetical protein
VDESQLLQLAVMTQNAQWIPPLPVNVVTRARKSPHALMTCGARLATYRRDAFFGSPTLVVPLGSCELAERLAGLERSTTPYPIGRQEPGNDAN